jgi:ribosomal protein S27AE
MYNIDKEYLIPIEEISCPGCGRKYGHHRTKVDLKSEECSACATEFMSKDALELVEATYFIEEVLGYKKMKIKK